MHRWDVRFLRLAREVAKWSKDPGTRVGAVAVDSEKRILSVGYNGLPAGMNDDDRIKDREFKLRYTVHAELNLILNAGKTGTRLKDSTLYVYGLPVCADCAKSVAQAGFKRIVMCYGLGERPDWEESHKHSSALFNEVGIVCDYIMTRVLDD